MDIHKPEGVSKVHKDLALNPGVASFGEAICMLEECIVHIITFHHLICQGVNKKRLL